MSNIRYMKFIYITFVLIFLSSKVLAQDVIKILVDRPDSVNKDHYEKVYKDMEEAFAKESSKELNTKLQFIIAEKPVNRSKSEYYPEYVKYILEQFRESTVDMVVLSDDFLYSETSEIESTDVNLITGERLIHRKYYLDFKEYSNFNEIRLKGYSHDILADCKHEDHIYALPYEIDFDVLYYRNKNGTNTIDTYNLTWENLLNNDYTKDDEKRNLRMGIKEGDELLSFFVEYIHSIANFKEKKNYDLLFNDHTIFDNFKDFAIKTDSHKMELKTACDSFLKGESAFFKGKISHYPTLKEVDESITPILLPQNKTIVHKKYIVINKNSEKNKDLLYRTAQFLHSEEIQQKRFISYGMVPPAIDFLTIDDPQYQEYLNLYKKAEKINIKDVFTNEKNAPFMEVEFYLPEALREFIGNKRDHKYLQNIFENIESLVHHKRDVKHLPILVVFVPAFFSLMSALVIIYLIIKYRNHPILKICSPNFCVFIVFGLALNVVFVCVGFEGDRKSLCSLYYILATLTTDFTLYPMVAVTYRIYKILTNNTRVDVSQNLNRRVSICFTIILTVMVAYACFIGLFVLDFYVRAIGNITNFRMSNCDYSSNFKFLEIIERRINEIIYIFMVYMVIRSARISKRFGEFKYIYMMFLEGIYEYFKNYIMMKLPESSLYYSYIIIISVQVFLDAILIYFLIGSRIIYVMTHPEGDKDRRKSSNKYYKDGYFDSLSEQEETTRRDGYHSHFSSKNSGCRTYSDGKLDSRQFNLSSNTTISEFDCRYDSSNNIFNQGFNSFNGFGDKPLPTNNSNNSRINNQDTYSSQKTLGIHDSQINSNNNICISINDLKKNDSSSSIPNHILSSSNPSFHQSNSYLISNNNNTSISMNNNIGVNDNPTDDDGDDHSPKKISINY